MNKITFPLEPQMRGPEIDDLQAALQLLLDRRAILANDEAARIDLADALQKERTELVYGEATGRGVAIFQEDRQLERHGWVDEATAIALNAAVESLPPLLIVRGQVRRADGSALVGALVRAFDRDRRDEGLGEASTNNTGHYAITYTVDSLVPLGRKNANLFIQVLGPDQKVLVESTVHPEAEPVEIIDLVVKDEEQPKDVFAVQGHVRGLDGNPLAGLIVRASDRDLPSRRRDEPLGEAVTDEAGFYRIEYTADKFSRSEKATADLQVRVYPPNSPITGKVPALAESETRFNAKPDETIDLVVAASQYRGLSEVERLLAIVTPLVEGVSIADLTVEDSEFLAGETGLDQQLIAWLAASALRAQEQDLLQREEYYGLFRQNLPTELGALLEQETAILRGALENSGRDNIVRPRVEQELVDFAGRVLHLKAGRLLRPSGENEPASLGDLLTVAIDAEKRQLIANYFVQHAEVTDTFWKALEEDSNIKPDEVQAVKQTLALGSFTDNHLPLVRELYRMGNGNPAFAELRGCAQFDEMEWQALLQRRQNPDDQNSKPIGFPPGQESIESYARTLNQFIEKTFPTAVIANRLERDTSNESPFKATKSDLLKFLANNPAFSFSDTPPDVYLSDGASEKLRDIENPQALKAQLKGMKRAFNVTQSFLGISAFLTDGLDSSTAITYLGERKFTARYGEPLGSIEKARGVYKRAAHIHATALNVYMKHAEAFNSPTPYVIPGGKKEKPVAPSFLTANRAAVRSLPDYSTLFGSLDLCNCQHCLSLYSPAAYLVDILKFLESGPLTKGMSPLDMLRTHRPDLEHVELTCENTHTELPYVDLVNEILEATVVPRSFTIAEGTEINAVLAALDKQTVPASFPTAFAKQGYALTDHASVRLDDGLSGREWVILDKGWAFSVRYQDFNDGFLVIAWPQTNWTVGELRANPEHSYDLAYARLRDAVYPWNLPFNLPLAEVRTYLGHLGVQRHEVMATLLAPNEESDYAIALEYLGLATEEADIITGMTIGGPLGMPLPWGDWNFWGLQQTGNSIVDRTDGAVRPAEGDWDVVLQRVSIFLQQSGLSYIELLELLGTSFINPPVLANIPGGRLLGIVAVDAADAATCTLSQLEIQIIDNDNAILNKQEKLKAVWNRIHRFVRLWRKLGWTMRDLDKAMRAQPKNTNGEVDLDDSFLLKLAHIQRLHVEMRLPVVNLLSWWADINTVPYIDHLADGEPVVASLYTQLFNNKTVSGQLVGEHPDALSGTLAGKSAAIAAALQISVADFTLLHTNEKVIVRIPAPLPFGIVVMIPDDRLSLSNLSALYRHATLAKVLKLPIRSYLTTLELVDSAPFATSVSTIQFIKQIDKIRAAGFTIDELDYLLRNPFSVTSASVAPDDLIEPVLDELRADLRKVSAENGFVEAGVDENATADPNGELTRKKLALLNWDAALIEQIIAVLNDTYTYETKLTTLTAGIVFPASLKSRISHDSTGEKLRFTGTLTAGEQTLLLALPNADLPFTQAVNALFAAPKTFVERYMARFSVPIFSMTVTDADLKLLLAKFKFPNVLKDKIYYSTVMKTLNFVGVMTETERNRLLKLVSNNAYTDNIEVLFNEPNTTTPPTDDLFLTSAHAATMFASATITPEDRFTLVLSRLLPHLQTALSERVVKQRLGEYLKLDADVIDDLLKKWITAQVDSQQKAIADFLDPTFINSNPNIGSSKSAFPAQFNAVLRLQKIASLVLKFKITPRQLQWLFNPKLNMGWLDLNALPIDAAPTLALFQGWARLADLFQLRDALPQGEALLSAIFTRAIAPVPHTNPGTQLDTVLKILSKGTQWELSSLQFFISGNGLDLSVHDFAGEAALLRLSSAFALLKRLGASAEQCLAWANPSPTADDAREIRSAVRAKYDAAQWLDVAKGLRDPLRERQRAALVAYLVHRLGVRDVNELYARFLIDVEMSPCMITTRIKQAISSVQLFIQRSLMSLESNVALTTDDAKEWTQWRKWYRVWEANRKVLFYPENWIEPELRDDKSPFYKDLENELLQSDVTMATAEDAFLHYLEKLDQVARLEIVGMYHQKEYLTNSLQPEIDIVHVFGRTYATAHIYFYRRLEGGVWSAWEKVELDIEGDHLIPIAWNRRLYLFWAIFTEKSEQPTKEQRQNDDDPNKYWEIKLAWSEYKNGSWSAKKVSKQLLRHNMYPYLTKEVPKLPPLDVPQKPQDFSFKTRVVQGLAGEQLSIECYSTTLVPAPLPTTGTPPPAPSMIAQSYAISIATGWRGTFGEVRIDLITNDGSENRIYFKPSLHFNTGRQFLAGGSAQDLGNPPNWIDSISIETADGSGGILGAGLDLRTVKKIRVFWKKYNDTDGWSFKGIKIVATLVSGVEVPMLINGLPKSSMDPELKLFARFETDTYWEGDATVVALAAPAPVVSGQSQTPKPMQGIGEFTLDASNSDIAAVPVVNGIPSLNPAGLIPYPNTQIHGMQFVEIQDDKIQSEYPLMIPPPGMGAILNSTPGTFRLLASHQNVEITLQSQYFFQDGQRTYFVSPIQNAIQFAISFHPRVHEFIRTLNHDGIPGLLTLQNQQLTDWRPTVLTSTFWTQYSPAGLYQSRDSLPKEDVDFEYEGAYSLYNWEMFFHTPLLIATQLTKNQRFDEAQKWFHYIFDPTATDSPDRQDNPGIERFWRVKPFYEEAMRDIQTLEELIKDSDKLKEQVAKWEADPFKPHVIARMRVVAYMKAVVMSYIDNLIAWGDQLFRRETLESINEATQLYILAAQILGRRPESIPARAIAKIQTFHTLDDKEALNSLSNAVVEIESFLPPSVAPISAAGTQGDTPLMPFFCIPGNDKLLGYWDTVADRLFKLRHCMNIEGIERSLPTFEPEIDPGLLVRAAAAGIDISSALNDINAAVPHYRFNLMVQKASELCNDVKALGGAFLSALEKRDAEALALLRSGHEVELLEAIRGIKEQQIEEANSTLQGLMKYEDVVTTRQQYYQTRPFMNSFEEGHKVLTTASLYAMEAHAGAEVLAAVLHLIPNTKGGAVPTIGVTYGGANVASAVQAFGSATGTIATMLNTVASLSATQGGYQRRQDDWTHQADLATKELEQVKKQIIAAQIRLAIADIELQNHDRQIKNAKEMDAYMRHQKFTNQQLYSWMVGQLAGIYFQSYQLAYDVAKRAERTYRYELGLRDSNFIQFGYWDSLKKGLLAGEKLHYDLKRMDVAYLDKNKREYEITKHVSLVLHDPLALIRLKETGQCEVELPEALFDTDYPGHYMRRLKSVSLTIPCVVGPYTSINCTLTLLNSKTRFDSKANNAQIYAAQHEGQVKSNFGAIQSIATSHAQNDSGLFELNFRDERYLPFEGSGAISRWRVELPQDCNAFDFNTLSDVVLHLKYMARDGGGMLKLAAKAALQAAIADVDNGSLARLFSAKHEFPTEWYRFLHPTDPTVGEDIIQILDLNLTPERFPFQFKGRRIAIHATRVFLKLKAKYDDATPLAFDLLKKPSNDSAVALATGIPFKIAGSPINGLPHVQAFEGQTESLGKWSIEVKEKIGENGNAVNNIERLPPTLRQTVKINAEDHFRLNPDAIEDMWLICHYSLTQGT